MPKYRDQLPKSHDQMPKYHDQLPKYNLHGVCSSTNSKSSEHPGFPLTQHTPALPLLQQSSVSLLMAHSKNEDVLFLMLLTSSLSEFTVLLSKKSSLCLLYIHDGLMTDRQKWDKWSFCENVTTYYIKIVGLRKQQRSAQLTINNKLKKIVGYWSLHNWQWIIS